MQFLFLKHHFLHFSNSICDPDSVINYNYCYFKHLTILCIFYLTKEKLHKIIYLGDKVNNPGNKIKREKNRRMMFSYLSTHLTQLLLQFTNICLGTCHLLSIATTTIAGRQQCIVVLLFLIQHKAQCLHFWKFHFPHFMLLHRRKNNNISCVNSIYFFFSLNIQHIFFIFKNFQWYLLETQWENSKKLSFEN